MLSSEPILDQSDMDVWLQMDQADAVFKRLEEERVLYLKRLIAEPSESNAQKIKTLDKIIGLIKKPFDKNRR